MVATWTGLNLVSLTCPRAGVSGCEEIHRYLTNVAGPSLGRTVSNQVVRNAPTVVRPSAVGMPAVSCCWSFPSLLAGACQPL
jgi:hypothetical protein